MMRTRESHLELTPVAARQLKRICLEEEADPIVRLYIAGRMCCGFHYGLSVGEIVRADDIVVAVDIDGAGDGVRLVLDPQIREHCANARIDFVDTGRGAGFIVDLPDAAESCGCDGHLPAG
jgi:iron-sulfur cluster assembly accessory protein